MTGPRPPRGIDVGGVDRRAFLRVVSAGVAGLCAGGTGPFAAPDAPTPGRADAFRFAVIADAHLSVDPRNYRAEKALLRAVADVNAMDPQPDFVVFGGDLARDGRKDALAFGARILKAVKAPVRMVVGDHDRHLDGGVAWRALFGDDAYAWTHKGVRFVVVNGVRRVGEGASSATRDGAIQGPLHADDRRWAAFEVGEEGRARLAAHLSGVTKETPVVVLSHGPLYKLHRGWNLWTEDAETVQAILAPFDRVTVVHAHAHQPLAHRIGRIDFHGMLATAFPLPRPPEGVPPLTFPIDRPNPFNPADGCGIGWVRIAADGTADVTHAWWNREPTTVTGRRMRSGGVEDPPPRARRSSY